MYYCSYILILINLFIRKPFCYLILSHDIIFYCIILFNGIEISRRLFDTCGIEPVHKAIPSCSEHYAVLNSANLGKFQSLSPADGHGPMHVQVS